eukprot:3441794-Lingulodinium_polyedra.AAC.1
MPRPSTYTASCVRIHSKSKPFARFSEAIPQYVYHAPPLAGIDRDWLNRTHCGRPSMTRFIAWPYNGASELIKTKSLSTRANSC